MGRLIGERVLFTLREKLRRKTVQPTNFSMTYLLGKTDSYFEYAAMSLADGVQRNETILKITILPNLS